MRILGVVLAWFLVSLAADPISAEGRFALSTWRTLSPTTGWTLVSGDFTGDGLSDLVGYYEGNGSIWMIVNTGTAFTAAQWTVVAPGSDWQFQAGEFTGDGVLDLVGYHPSNGTVWVGTNTGTTFSFSLWGTLSPATGWQIVAGDFAGSARSDVMAYYTGSGLLRVGTNTGSAFSFGNWATVSPASGWHFVAGHFTQSDGPLDLAAYHDSQSLWVGDNTGSAFSFQQWGAAPVALARIVAGEFSGDDRTDIAGYGSGGLLIGANLGTKFSMRSSDTWATGVGAAFGDTFVSGDFTGSPEDDLAGNAAGDLRVADNLQPMQGYAWPLSGSPGQTIDFMISGRGDPTATFLRHKADGSGPSSAVMGTASFTPTPRQEPEFSYRDGCGWPASLSLAIPSDWPSGIYSARVTNRDGSQFHLPFVVKPAPSAHSAVAVIANVNTWLAYNNWGGKSHYQGGADLSFLRPNPSASPVEETYPPFAFTHPYQLARGELWPLTWLEDSGYHPDVYTDIDLHDGLPAGYQVLVLTTHPEYWSTQMYDNLRTFLTGGGSLLYLGGNGIWESVEVLPGKTKLRFMGGVENVPATSNAHSGNLFRRLMPSRPERAVLGVATEACGVVGSAYRVLAPNHPIMQCAGLSLDQPIGATGLHQALYNTTLTNGAAAGLETDTSAGPGATGYPSLCGFGGDPVPPVTLPAGLEVLAAAESDGQRTAEITIYDHPGGGFVLSTGSLTFGGSLAVDPDLQALISCALTAAPEPAGGLGCGLVLLFALARRPQPRRTDRRRVDAADRVLLADGLRWRRGPSS
jgi:hypothetical protein